MNEKSSAPDPPGLLKRSFLRYGLQFFVGCYLRVRHERFDLLPEPPYLLNFSHPSWVDPFLVASHLPRGHTIYVFGPKEQDMSTGLRNQLIRWSHMGVPFAPSKSNLLDTTRRATSVLKAGHVLAIAGEGRVSDREGEILPLEDGPAFFALRAGVPISPMAIIGTRWIHFGKTVRMRVGPPVELCGRRADRAGVLSLTADLQAAMDLLVVDVPEDAPTSRFSRWFSELLNERPTPDLPDPGDPPAGDDAPAPSPSGERR